MMPPLEYFVYLVYLDDSTTDSTEHQLIVAVIMSEEHFRDVEEFLASLVDEYVPEEMRSAFEFHASAMFHGKKPFENLPREKALELFASCASIIEQAPVPVVYGGVNCHKLRGGLFATAQPIDIAFRVCVQTVEEWFAKNAPDNLGLLIADNTKNTHVRDTMQAAFRSYRRPLKSATHSRGKLEHLHDDMYFGESANSVGIQLADICAFLICRYLEGKADTDYIYKIIEPHIFYGNPDFGGAPLVSPKMTRVVATPLLEQLDGPAEEQTGPAEEQADAATPE